MKDFRDKVAVITGGASGIGFATAQALAKLGSRVVLADIEDDVLASATNELAGAGASVIGVRTDVGDKASVEGLADKSWSEFGGVDILFNNAGVALVENMA